LTSCPQSNRRIVVVDDDTDILESISIVLRGAGYDAQTASNGAHGLDIMRRTQPCLVLLDLMMPGMNGWQFRAEQMREAAIATIPTVVMTGFPAAVENGATLCPAACLKKPIDLDDLLDTVARFCSS
jgi:DNA-binding response OmpR family regulator